MASEEWEKYLKDSLITEEMYSEAGGADHEDAYASELKFGTAGIRGKIGLGPNRLNRYTVERVAEGLSRQMQKEGGGRVVIGYDIRHLSRAFSEAIASVLVQNDIEVYLSEGYITTPELSFFTRRHEADYGIMITASHNPPEYNGIKVYGSDGAQLTDVPAGALSDEINAVEDFFDIPSADFDDALEAGRVIHIDYRHYEDYQQKVKSISGDIPESDLQVVFSSLHGTALPVVEYILRDLGFHHLHLVPDECEVDSDFSHVASPNPEDVQAFAGARKLGREAGADLLVATDPDADRIGVEVWHEDDYVHLDGNQLGAILLHNRLEGTEFERLPVVVKSVVTSDLSRKISEKFGAELVEVLTGFKYIGAVARSLEADDAREFAFGYEESYGYLISDFVRDKDAVQIVPAIVKLAAGLKNEGLTLVDYLEKIYAEFGPQREKMISHTFEGMEGRERISEIMDQFRRNTPREIEGRQVRCVEDYLSGERRFESGETAKIDLPSADVIKIHFDDGWIALRPSGTEPKIKLYVSLETDHIDEEAKIINDMIFGV
ncbi:phospho-sugar mutase [Lacicoccus alkaliphilus]|uniref:Phosphoglucomutase n=1 Tax=Lacicoccus alkaliphilus DSM 16010 TaxID=1123231 RepID=A0A1M7CDG5_9BACL|nr:phospho-sugar mutase [Salinicoccus alkaliphilus]SHL65251.1 phosphoglucomutase [Salinicoccus alkaliphilus DSM 16010]